MSKFDRYYGWYKPTPAREVKGGIKAQSKRGDFANKWWGKHWIQVLEGFRIGARLTRGRSYARKGQVASLTIEKGSVTASVQGSRRTPYHVRIKFKTYTEKQWRQVVDLLIEQPIFTAQLLSNEMPQDVETVFNRAKLLLFPQRQKDLVTDCSCPDWSNPCKHIAAVFYLMAEAFDTDPFLLFKLRGMDREALLAALHEGGAVQGETQPGPEPDPLPIDHHDFWGSRTESLSLPMPPRPKLHAALPKRLGPLPLWRSNKNVIAEMESIYAKTSGQAENWFHKLSKF